MPATHAQTYRFEVEVVFSGPLQGSKEEIAAQLHEVAGNLEDALRWWLDGHGIAPEDSEVWTVDVIARPM